MSVILSFGLENEVTGFDSMINGEDMRGLYDYASIFSCYLIAKIMLYNGFFTLSCKDLLN